jgi:hypothetical protein
MRFVYLVFVAVVLVISCGFWNSCANLREVTQEEYNKIISLILSQIGDSDIYTYIVDPEMSLKRVSTEKERIKNEFASDGYDFNSLIEELFDRNLTPLNMDIPSSPEYGYIIDYDKKYSNYKSWEDFLSENPNHGFANISMAVYDPETGIVIVYVSWQRGPLYGAGGINAYKYEDNKLTNIAYVLLWIS